MAALLPADKEALPDEKVILVHRPIPVQVHAPVDAAAVALPVLDRLQQRRPIFRVQHAIVVEVGNINMQKDIWINVSI